MYVLLTCSGVPATAVNFPSWFCTTLRKSKKACPLGCLLGFTSRVRRVTLGFCLLWLTLEVAELQAIPQ